MSEQLPVRKYITVWIKNRKNPPRRDGSVTVSYTLEWVEFGERRFMSLGRNATLAYARQAKKEKEQELNDSERRESLVPVTWDNFQKKYLDTYYPGHDLPPAQRKIKAREWGKSFNTMRAEKLTITNFTRLLAPGWCHEVTAEARETFVQKRLAEKHHKSEETISAESVDADLRVLRLLFNVMEEWKHRPRNSNPFAGRGKATVGARRKRAKAKEQTTAAEHYTVEQLNKLLDQADKEAREAGPRYAWQRHRLRALVYFMAYTGARINEAIHLEWEDIDWENSVAWLYFKIENDLKTVGSEAPFGLPDALVTALKEWKEMKTCEWVFPNADKKPWVAAGPGYKHLDQLKALAQRAGIEHANWKMFRHALATHGKQRFGMTREQVQAQLRHTTADTQEHYTHDDLHNLRDAVKGIDFRKAVSGDRAAEAPPGP
jgi:integrase